MGEVQGMQSESDGERATEAGDTAVHATEPEINHPLICISCGAGFESGNQAAHCPKCAQEKGIREQLEAMSLTPPAVSPVAVAERRPHTFYGSPTNPKYAGPHNGHVAPQGVHYACEDCQDLYERVKKAFKDMGHEF